MRIIVILNEYILRKSKNKYYYFALVKGELAIEYLRLSFTIKISSAETSKIALVVMQVAMRLQILI